MFLEKKRKLSTKTKKQENANVSRETRQVSKKQAVKEQKHTNRDEFAPS